MTVRCCNTCCPEAPAISVTQNILTLDGETAYWRDENYLGENATSRVITLPYTPYSAATVQVSLNTGVLRRTHDFVVVANTIRLMFDPADDDKIHVRYLTVGSGTVTLMSSDSSVGQLSGFSGSTAPDGWFLMDGSQVVDATTYTELHAFLAAHTDLTDGAGAIYGADEDSYKLKALSSSFYDVASGTMVVSNTIIKHD